MCIRDSGDVVGMLWELVAEFPSKGGMLLILFRNSLLWRHRPNLSHLIRYRRAYFWLRSPGELPAMLAAGDVFDGVVLPREAVQSRQVLRWDLLLESWVGFQHGQKLLG